MSMKVKEFTIPVSWGEIAVKAWGDDRNKAVLVVHGRMDNAGSFDRLIPQLLNTYYYVCIDLPGHGRSTHFPPHLPLYTINYILAYKLIMQFLKRETYIILGHSYGGHIGFLFAQLYPNYVEKLIMLDTIHIYPVPVQRFKKYLLSRFESTLKISEQLSTGKKPTYTYDEAFQRVLQGRATTPLTPEAATALLQRAVTPTSDGQYEFTLDQRMKWFVDPLHDFRYAIETMKNDPVTCPVLIILGKESVEQQVYMAPVTKVLKKWKNVDIKYVEGGHDVHNNNPEYVAPYINKFLVTQKVPVEKYSVKNYVRKTLTFLKWVK